MRSHLQTRAYQGLIPQTNKENRNLAFVWLTTMKCEQLVCVIAASEAGRPLPLQSSQHVQKVILVADIFYSDRHT